MTHINSLKKRDPSLDLLKAIAMLMVVILHVGLFHGNFIAHPKIGTYIQYAFRLLSEGVPLFVVVNGYLLLHREGNDYKKIFRKIKKIAIIFCGWALFMILIKMVIWHHPLPFNEIVITFLKTDISNKYNGVLWFLQNLIALYFLVPLIKLIRDQSIVFYRYFFGLAFVFSIGLNALRFVTNVLVAFTGMNHILDLNAFIGHLNPIGNGHFIFFFMLGDFIWQYREKLKENVRNCVVAALVFWGGAAGIAIAVSLKTHKIYPESFNYGSIFMVFIIIGWFAVASLYKGNNERIRKIIESIGANTMGIYLMHTILIALASQYHLVSYLKRPLLTLAVYFASFLLSWLIMKVPYLRNTVKL